MTRGPKKHPRAHHAPRHWMSDKLGGVFAPRPSTGPHKLRECLPLIILLRNRLKYALTKKEVTSILMQRLIQVDGKVRTDATYPAGFMDVISIEKTSEHFRLLLDTKGRFFIHRIQPEEAKYKLLKVRRRQLGAKGIPYVVTHDGRTIRFPDPQITNGDTIKFDLENNKIVDFVKFDVGNLAVITGGNNAGRIGVVEHRERHDADYDIVHVKDAAGHTFATRDTNVFIIGQGTKSLVSLPKRKGVKASIIEEQQHFLQMQIKKQRGAVAAASAQSS